MFIFLSFFFIIPIQGQTSVDTTLVKNIVVDTSAIEQIYFNENFKDKYNDKPFIYEEKSPVIKVAGFLS